MARRTLREVFPEAMESEPEFNGVVPTAPFVEPVVKHVVNVGEVDRQVFDPTTMRSSLKDLIPEDDLFWAIENQFRDRQQYGRIAFETAYKHEVVGAAFKARLAILTSKKPTFKVRVREPTQTQVDMAAFANHAIETLRWGKFIEGYIGQGLEFGFSLAEIVTKFGVWNGNDAILLDYLAVLPQASLDHGFVPRAEYNESFFEKDGRYRCLEFDSKGRIQAYKQFAYTNNKEKIVEWRGADMRRILHFTHGGGDGNPWGESALYHTMSAWLNLYAIERMEDAFLDTSQPWMFGTYKSTAGETRQKVHEGAKEALSKAHVDAARRFLMWADGDLKSVAPSNENFTDHVFRKKAELEARIWQTLLLPKSAVAETDTSDGDSRNLIQVFFKHIIKSDLEEIGEILTDLITRLLHQNFSNIQTDDVPVCTWSLVTENEIRVAQGILSSVIQHVDSESLPDFIHSLFDFVDPKYIAANHAESVEMKRPKKEPDPEPGAPGTPPTKEPGSQRERFDGQTENPSGTTSTST